MSDGNKIQIDDYDLGSVEESSISYELQTDTFKTNGYHTTLKADGNQIMLSGKFIPSNGDKEWLGKGIYFWESEKDGRFWSKVVKKRACGGKKSCKGAIETVIIICELCCLKEQYLDLDRQMDKLKKYVEEYLCELRKKGSVVPKFDNSDQRKRLYCNLYKDEYNIQIMSYTFPYKIMDNAVGFAELKSRKQFCVTSNDCITILDKKEIL